MILIVFIIAKLVLGLTLWLLLRPKRLRRTQPATKKRVFEFECTGWLARKILSSHGSSMFGFTLPLPFCALILYAVTSETSEESRRLVRVHEFVHVAQDERNLCFLVTWLKYLYEDARLICNGAKVWQAYQLNKYEIEAYDVQWDIMDGVRKMPEWA